MTEKNNLPVLYLNAMDSLPSDFARDLFLWASDKFENDRWAYKAEAFAREHANMIETVARLMQHCEKSKLLKTGGHLTTEEQTKDLLRFIQSRHANYCLGGNVKSQPPEVRAA